MTTIMMRRADRPAEDRRLSAEWEPQSAVMLTWPHADSDWADTLAAADRTFAAIAAAISHHQTVLVTLARSAERERVEAALQEAGADRAHVRFANAPSDDVFVRDHGPLTVATSHGLKLLDFSFNGWGRKYPYQRDDALTRTLYEQGAFGHIPREAVDFVLEGGSIDSDGAGTLLVTASCLLAPTRNPQHTRADIEAILAAQLGAQRILWLHHGYLAGDDTDGHIDTLARFCDPATIAYCACPYADDEHYPALQAMEQELKTLRTADGQPYRLVPLPWPSAKLANDGTRLPATYANFLILNGAVLVPTYDDSKDTEALAILSACFPGRRIIGIPCLTLIAQHGSLHCVTMQIPAGVLT